MEGLINFIQSVASLVINMLQSLVKLITLIPTYLNYALTAVNILPDILVQFAIFSLLIYLIFWFIGRSPE